MATSNKKARSHRPHNALPRRKAFVPPTTITLPPMLKSGGDVAFRETLYLMALTFSRLYALRLCESPTSLARSNSKKDRIIT